MAKKRLTDKELLAWFDDLCTTQKRWIELCNMHDEVIVCDGTSDTTVQISSLSEKSYYRLAKLLDKEIKSEYLGDKYKNLTHNIELSFEYMGFNVIMLLEGDEIDE